MKYLLGVDAGTTAFKAALFNEDKRLICVEQRDYTLLTPSENIVEFPAEEYWLHFLRTDSSVAGPVRHMRGADRRPRHQQSGGNLVLLGLRRAAAGQWNRVVG